MNKMQINKEKLLEHIKFLIRNNMIQKAVDWDKNYINFTIYNNIAINFSKAAKENNFIPNELTFLIWYKMNYE